MLCALSDGGPTGACGIGARPRMTWDTGCRVGLPRWGQPMRWGGHGPRRDVVWMTAAADGTRSWDFISREPSGRGGWAVLASWRTDDGLPSLLSGHGGVRGRVKRAAAVAHEQKEVAMGAGGGAQAPFCRHSRSTLARRLGDMHAPHRLPMAETNHGRGVVRALRRGLARVQGRAMARWLGGDSSELRPLARRPPLGAAVDVLVGVCPGRPHSYSTHEGRWRMDAGGQGHPWAAGLAERRRPLGG